MVYGRKENDGTNGVTQGRKALDEFRCAVKDWSVTMKHTQIFPMILIILQFGAGVVCAEIVI